MTAPSVIRFYWHFNCLLLRPSHPGHPTVYSGDPGLGQQCVAGRPLCLFAKRLSSCSSTGACDFVVGSADCATSMGTTSPGPKLTPLSPLGCSVLSAAAYDECAFATRGFGRFVTGFGGALTPSPLPTSNGAPELAGTTITSLCSTACLVTVRASPAAASSGRLSTGVPRVATSKLDSSRSDVGTRRIVRATTMPTLVPMW